MSPYAPIILFAYNRPAHLKHAVDSLLKNPEAAESELTIYSDGPKNDIDQKSVADVRRFIKTISGFSKLQIVEREKNWGLANSVIDGVTSTLAHSESLIVLEDDLLVSPYFLKFMNEGIKTYKNDAQVCSIHGYSYPIAKDDQIYFLRGGDCWGWATWRSAWSHFQPDGRILLKELREKKLSFEFDLRGALGFEKMLYNQTLGLNNSWAIRWRAATFLKNMYTVYPPISLVQNIGFDGSGTHCTPGDKFDVTLSSKVVSVVKLEAKEDPEIQSRYLQFLNPTWKSRFRRTLRWVEYFMTHSIR